MSNWVQHILGFKSIPEKALIICGTIERNFQRDLLKCFDSYNQSKTHFGKYIVSIKGEKIFLAFHIYGAPQIFDLTSALKKGNCQKVIMVGYAHSQILKCGECLLPNKVYCLDGITTIRSKNLKIVKPNNKMLNSAKRFFTSNQITFYVKPTISVSSIFQRASHIRQKTQKKIFGLELELSSLLYCSRINSMRALGILFVSDNDKHKLENGRKERYSHLKSKIRLIANFLVQDKY